MVEGGRCDHAVRGIKRCPLQLTLPVQYAPAIGYGVRDWQNASLKTREQIIFKPPFQLNTPLTCRKQDKSSPQLADRYNAQVEQLFVLCVDPVRDAWVGTRSD